MRLERGDAPGAAPGRRRVVELPDPVVRRGADVEVEPPVGVVVVDVADALALRGGESEAGADHAGEPEPPPADVPVPAGLHLADQLDLAVVQRNSDTEECAGDGDGLHDGLGGATVA